LLNHWKITIVLSLKYLGWIYSVVWPCKWISRWYRRSCARITEIWMIIWPLVPGHLRVASCVMRTGWVFLILLMCRLLQCLMFLSVWGVSLSFICDKFILARSFRFWLLLIFYDRHASIAVWTRNLLVLCWILTVSKTAACNSSLGGLVGILDKLISINHV